MRCGCEDDGERDFEITLSTLVGADGYQNSTDASKGGRGDHILGIVL